MEGKSSQGERTKKLSERHYQWGTAAIAVTLHTPETHYTKANGESLTGDQATLSDSLAIDHHIN